MRGRKPKCDRLKILGGTFRPDRKRHPPQPKSAGLKCPAFLSAIAKKEWKRLKAAMEAMGMLTRLDQAGFAIVCQLWSRRREAEEILTVEGLQYTTPTGHRRAHPMVAVAASTLAQLRNFCQEFGLTPASRLRLSGLPAPVPESPDPLEIYLGLQNKSG